MNLTWLSTTSPPPHEGVEVFHSLPKRMVTSGTLTLLVAISRGVNMGLFLHPNPFTLSRDCLFLSQPWLLLRVWGSSVH